MIYSQIIEALVLNFIPKRLIFGGPNNIFIPITQYDNDVKIKIAKKNIQSLLGFLKSNS